MTGVSPAVPLVRRIRRRQRSHLRRRCCRLLLVGAGELLLLGGCQLLRFGLPCRRLRCFGCVCLPLLLGYSVTRPRQSTVTPRIACDSRPEQSSSATHHVCRCMHACKTLRTKRGGDVVVTGVRKGVTGEHLSIVDLRRRQPSLRPPRRSQRRLYVLPSLRPCSASPPLPSRSRRPSLPSPSCIRCNKVG